MRARTARFDAMMTSSAQTTRCRVDILYGGLAVASDIGFTSGHIDFDATSNVWASGQVSLVDLDRIPTRAVPGIITPFGYELAIYGGAVYGTDDEELLPLGVFPIQRVTVDGTSLAMTVDFADRSQAVRDARLEDDWPIAADTNIGTALQALIADGVPGLTYQFASTDYTVSSATVIPALSDRWEAAIGLARDAGCIIYFGNVGQCVLALEDIADTAPAVFTFEQGSAGTLISASLILDRADVYNRTIAVGSDPALGFVPRGVATDTDSVVGYTSGFGHKPRGYASPFLRTDAQAGTAAASVQASDAGNAWSVEFEAVTHYAIEPRDVIGVVHDRLDIDATFVLDRFSFDLTSSGSMSSGGAM